MYINLQMNKCINIHGILAYRIRNVIQLPPQNKIEDNENWIKAYFLSQNSSEREDCNNGEPPRKIIPEKNSLRQVWNSVCLKVKSYQQQNKRQETLNLPFIKH